jgi:glycosyltransferase involved in cell wall biosynthesis
LKILHITETFAPLGGAELYMISQIALLEEAGVENVVVYWNEHPQTFPTGNYPVYHVTESEAERPAGIEAIIKEVRPTIIYLHTVRNPAVVAAAARMGTTIAYIHDFEPVCPGLAKFYRRGQRICTRPYGLGCVPMIYLQRCASAKHPLSVYRIMQAPPRYLAAYKQVGKVLVGSSYMKDLLVQNGLEAERITILPYFFHMPGRTTPVPLGVDDPRLLFVGRLEEEKGLAFLLRALARLSRPYRLLVAGEGSGQKGYEALAQKLGIAGQVDFLGWLSPEEIKRVYEKVVCLVFPSIWPEPFGMVGIEAFYNSRPVIAFDVGGVSDWLQDGWNGYLIPPQDVEQLAGCIERLLEKPGLASQMGSNGYRFVEDHYGVEQHLAQLMAVLRRETGFLMKNPVS